MDRGFYPVMDLYGSEGCGKTRLLREFLHKLRSDEYVAIYIDAQSVHRLDDAVLVSDKTLIDILTKLVEGVGGPIGRALAIAITSIAKNWGGS